MTKRFCLAVLIVVVLWLPVLGADELTVLSPNTNAYSATELLSLQTAMKNLQDLLGDYGLGSGRYFASTEWMNPDFAPIQREYWPPMDIRHVLLHKKVGPDGEHVWVLVRIVLPTRTAWIPVEALPAMEKVQRTLGTIPEYVDGQARCGLRKNIQPLVKRSFFLATSHRLRQSV